MAPSGRLHNSRILAYGKDPILLQTRRMILEEAGFQVDTAVSVEKFSQYVDEANPPYGLFVLCHTISAPEQQAIGARAAQAHTPVYQLSVPVAPPDFLEKVCRLLPINVTRRKLRETNGHASPESSM
jgi:hypothetical protein